MRLGIVSDSHGNQRNVTQALKLLAERKVDVILHCGDIDDASTVWLFAGTPTHFVLGNCDADEREIEKAATASGGIFHGRFGELRLDSHSVAMIHGDDHERLRNTIQSGRFEYVFHGHTHKAKERQAGGTLVLNPGALHRASPKTAVVLDLATGEREWLRVAE
jgi:uncharacterized protein